MPTPSVSIQLTLSQRSINQWTGLSALRSARSSQLRHLIRASRHSKSGIWIQRRIYQMKQVPPPQWRRQSPEAAFIQNFELYTKSAFVVLSVAANVFLLVMLFRYGNMRSRAILFMANLCAADLAFSLLSTLSFIVELLTHGFKGGMVLCKLVRYLQLFGPYAASFAIVSMGVDRYLAIVHPLSSYIRSDRLAHAGWLLAALWLLSALVASPQLFLFTVSLRNCTLTADAKSLRHSSTESPHLLSISICGDIYEILPLWMLYASITFHIVIIYFIPAIILVYSYSTLSSRVWSSYNLRSLLSNSRHNYNASTSTTGTSNQSLTFNTRRVSCIVYFDTWKYIHDKLI